MVYRQPSGFAVQIAFRGILPGLYDAGISENHTVTGNITVYITIGSDQHIIADGDIAHNGGIDADPDAVADLCLLYTSPSPRD